MALTDALYSLFSYFVQWHKDNYQTLHGKNTIDAIYPLGSIYITTNNSNPSNLFPGTTWKQLTNTFLYAANSGNADVDTTTATAGYTDATLVWHNHTHSHQHRYDHYHEMQHQHMTPTFQRNQMWMSPDWYMFNDGNIQVNTTYRDKASGPAGHDWLYVHGVNYNNKSPTIYMHPYTGNSTRAGTASNTETDTRYTYTGDAVWTETDYKGDYQTSGKNMPPYMKVYMWKRTG